MVKKGDALPIVQIKINHNEKTTHRKPYDTLIQSVPERRLQLHLVIAQLGAGWEKAIAPLSLPKSIIATSNPIS